MVTASSPDGQRRAVSFDRVDRGDLGFPRPSRRAVPGRRPQLRRCEDGDVGLRPGIGLGHLVDTHRGVLRLRSGVRGFAVCGVALPGHARGSLRHPTSAPAGHEPSTGAARRRHLRPPRGGRRGRRPAVTRLLRPCRRGRSHARPHPRAAASRHPPCRLRPANDGDLSRRHRPQRGRASLSRSAAPPVDAEAWRPTCATTSPASSST